tara:strand:- start:57 stop:887 length:831 start_codon:yes stop_codon:yes gene_type:complete
MKKISRRKFTRILGCGCSMSLSSCSYNPINKRSQLSIVPERIVKHMSDEYYYEFLADNDLVKNKKLVKKVREIGKRIEIGIKKYFEKENRLDEYEKYQYDYEINIVKDKRTINAFAMPTAKIVFFSRILDFTKNEDEIATIMGHEMGHVVAWHSKERMSHAVALELVSSATGGIIGSGSALSEIGYFLPFSRFQETEADELGLRFMTLAGYKPESSVSFWMNLKNYSQKLEKYKSKHDIGARFLRNLPQVLRTHPITENRIKNLNRLIPKVKIEYL